MPVETESTIHAAAISAEALREGRANSAEALRERPNGFPVQAIEVFGGSARLTLQMQRNGIAALAVDWLRNQSKPQALSVMLDLTSQDGQNTLLATLATGTVRYCHLAPPCGTASRARQIRMSSAVHGPPPLRSDRFPDGLHGVKGVDAERLRLANLLYQFTAECVMACQRHKVFWSIENPRNSLMWHTSFLAPVFQLHPLESLFQHCAYSGRRPKWTKLIHNVPCLRNLNKTCPGNHDHDPWGLVVTGTKAQFATAQEAAYPMELAAEWAKLVADGLFQPHELSALQTPACQTSSAAAVGKQRRGQKAPRLLPEFAAIQTLKLASCPWPEGHIFEDSVVINNILIPASSRLLRIELPALKGEDGQASSPRFCFVHLGIAWSKWSFLISAKEVAHPIDATKTLPEQMYDNLFFALTEGLDAVVARRAQVLSEWRNQAAQLEIREAHLHSSLPDEFKAPLRGKKFLLFKSLLEKWHHPDRELIKRMVSGFQILGKLEATMVFEPAPDSNPDSVSISDLMRGARTARAMVTASMGPVDGQLDHEVYQATLLEVQEGWARGPLTENDLVAKFGNMWLAAPRFGIRQQGKLRVIDDFSKAGQNATVNCSERMVMGGIDQVLELAKTMATAAGEDRSVRVVTPSGRVLMGALHSSLSLTQARTICGQAIDLQSAYKQLVRRRADSMAAVIAVWNPVAKQLDYFEAISLPFGSTGSVFGFNRVSEALNRVLVCELSLFICHYFDDFPILDFEGCAEASGQAAIDAFELLGWRVSKQKVKPVSGLIDILGVTVNLGEVADCGPMKVCNTEKRLLSLTAEIKEALDSDSLRPAQAASLRGRLAFAEGQHFGRLALMAARQLSLRAGHER